MKQKLWLVQYEDDQTGERRVCAMIAPTAHLVEILMLPHEVKHIVLLEN